MMCYNLYENESLNERINCFTYYCREYIECDKYLN